MTSSYPDRAAHDHFMTIFRTRTAQLGTRNGGKRRDLRLRELAECQKQPYGWRGKFAKNQMAIVTG